MPLSPARRRWNRSSTWHAREVTQPRPVTTTRRFMLDGARLRVLRFLDELNRLADGLNFFGGAVRNIDVEFLFQLHDQLDGVQRVGPQIVHERSFWRYLLFIDAKLLSDDLNDA